MIKKKLIDLVQGAAALGVAMLLSSCFETKDEITLNPDGSGKVRHECKFQEVSLTNDGDELSEEGMRDAVVEVLTKSEGVEAWKDVSYKRLDDGRIHFQGTAYFKDLASLDINNQTMLKFAWKDAGAGKAELVMQMDSEKEEQATDEKLSAEEQAEKLKTERAKFQQSKPMFAAILGGMKHKVSFKLPGKVTESRNFSKDAGGGLGIAFDGARLLEVLDVLMADDDWLAKQGFDRENGPEFDDKLSGLMFGEEGPVQAEVEGATAPLFDYAAEVALAKKETAELQKKLGAVGIVPAATGAPLKSVRVVGVRSIQELDKKLDLRPFNYDAGLSLSVLAEMSGSALDFTDACRIETAVASDGSSLLKGDKEWDKRISFPKLSKDKAQVLFEINLKSPGAGVTGIKELSGVLEYRVAGSSKEVDLGLETFEAGSKGAELSAEIKSVEDADPSEGSQEFGLKLKIRPDDLIAAYVVVDGERKELKRRGYGSSGGSTNFNFSSPAPLAEVGAIVFEIHDQLEAFQVPFKLENLSLAGTPLAR